MHVTKFLPTFYICAFIVLSLNCFDFSVPPKHVVIRENVLEATW